MTEEVKPAETSGSTPQRHLNASELPTHPGIYGSAVVGQLGRHDIQVLAGLAKSSHKILEFGCGGSTLALAQFSPPGARVTSIDSERAWIDKTRMNLERVGQKAKVDFLPYAGWEGRMGGWPWFDLIFVDGLESERLQFALNAWRTLQPGGTMAWHDCRWPQIVEMMLRLAGLNFQTVDVMSFCVLRSNITTITKKVEIPELNDPDKGRTDDWMSGTADLPGNWPCR